MYFKLTQSQVDIHLELGWSRVTFRGTPFRVLHFSVHFLTSPSRKIEITTLLHSHQGYNITILILTSIFKTHSIYSLALYTENSPYLIKLKSFLHFRSIRYKAAMYLLPLKVGFLFVKYKYVKLGLVGFLTVRMPIVFTDFISIWLILLVLINSLNNVPSIVSVEDTTDNHII